MNTKRLRTSALAALVTALFAVAHTGCTGMSFLQGGPTRPAPKHTVYELDNGMKVLIKEDHFSPVVAMQVWVDVGGADETDLDAGIAHVHEHMLFKGTATRGVGEIASEVEGAGGQVNAWTAWDNTVYHVVLASRYADQALDILADAVRHSSFDPVELRKELGVVMEEYKRGLDMPGSRLFQTLFASAYERHPYRRPVIGTEESILGITRKKVLDFYSGYYAPENITLVIVGDVDAGHMKERIAEELGGFASAEVKRPERPVEPAQAGLRFSEVRMDVEESHLAIGFHIGSATHAATPTLDVLAQILGGGASSRLYERLAVRSQLVTDISAYAYTPQDPGLFMISGSLEAEDAEPAFDAVMDEISNIRRLPVNAEELARARANLEAEFIYRSQTVQGQARELGQFITMYGDPEYATTYLKALAAVTPADLQRAARRYLSADNATVVTLVPENTSSALDEGAVRRMARAISDAEAQIDWASAPSAQAVAAKAVLALERPDSEPQIFTLQNGARVIVQEHHDVPLFAVRVGMLGGLLTETPENNGIAGFASAMLTRGTKTRSRSGFAREVESLAGHLDGFSGRNSIGLSGGFLSSHFNEGMDLFLDAFIEPAFDGDEVEKTRREILLAIKNRGDNTATIAFDLIYETMFPGHPYGMRTLGETASIESITSQDLTEFYSALRDPSKLVFSVVGDVDADAVIATISKRFRTQLHFDKNEFSVPTSPKPTQVQRAHVDVERAQAHIVLGFPGVNVRSEDRYAVSVLETILSGQGGRLFYSLRDVQGLAYSVTAFSSEGLADGIVGAYIATDPSNTGKAIRGLLAELKKISVHPVDAGELERAKRYLIGSHAIALQTNGAIADEMLFNELYGLGFLNGRKYEERISQISIDDVQAAARRYLRPEIRTVVTVGDSEVGKESASLD